MEIVKLTHGPWLIGDADDGYFVTDALANELASKIPTLELARRIVACVNACAGIPTEMLEATPSGPAAMVAAEREACAKVCESIGGMSGDYWTDKCAAAIRARSAA